LNELLEANIKIEEEEREMIEKVKKLQKARKADIKHGKVNLAVFDNHQNLRANDKEH
jgi:hypothetical protein